MPKERDIYRIENIPLYYDGTRSVPPVGPIGMGPGMDVEFMERMRRALRTMRAVGLQFSKLYHLGGDFSGSVPFHSNGVALDIQGFELDGEKFIMDPAFGKNSYTQRPDVWLRIDASLRKEFTFVLGYPYPDHHNHFHPQPGGTPPGQKIWDPARPGTSATMFLQQSLNFLLDGKLKGRLAVDGGLGNKTLGAWNEWRAKKGLPPLSEWSRRGFLLVCDDLIGRSVNAAIVVLNGETLENLSPLLVNGMLQVKLRPLANVAGWDIVNVDIDQLRVTLRSGAEEKAVPISLRGDAGHVYLRHLEEAGLVTIKWDPLKRTASLSAT